jgi:hypothetical protein
MWWNFSVDFVSRLMWGKQIVITKMSTWFEFEEQSAIAAALAVAVHENKSNWHSGWGNYRLVLRAGVRQEIVDENITTHD